MQYAHIYLAPIDPLGTFYRLFLGNMGSHTHSVEGHSRAFFLAKAQGDLYSKHNLYANTMHTTPMHA